MITNTGKSILAKYLVGQAPAYASYIAVGCGAEPLGSSANLNLLDYSDKQTLDFEMFRVPITSRGYVVEEVTVDDVVQKISKVVLTAELPTEERYEMSEVGIFSAGSNPSAGAYDSKTLYSFNTNENWEYHSQTAAEKIPTVYSPLDSIDSNIIDGEYKINPSTKQYDSGPDGVLVDTPAIQTTTDNHVFSFANRVEKHEKSRFLNNLIMLRGNSSEITTELDANQVTRLKIEDGSDHIHLYGTSVDLNRNAPTDELRLALSIVNRDGTAPSSVVPDEVRVMIEFSNSDDQDTGQWARFEAILSADDYDFVNNRYYVVTKQLQQLRKSTSFTWSSVNIVKIFACTLVSNTPSSEFYVVLDALRLENVSTTNSLYGLTGYSVIKTTDGLTVTKLSNTTNYVEFRFTVDVQ